MPFNYHDVVLYKEDMSLYSVGCWLNDQTINYAFRFFEFECFKRVSDGVIMMDPAVVSFMMIQCTDEEDEADFLAGLNVGKAEYILAPVNCQSSHWSLLVIDLNQKLYYHMDSMGQSLSNVKQFDAATKTLTKLARILK